MSTHPRTKKKKESWRFWDAILSSSLFAVIADSEEARKDDQKFKQLILSWLFAVLIAGIVFGVVWWLIV